MSDNSVAQFYISTEEDLRFGYTFTNRSFTGRTLLINVRERATNNVVASLSPPTQLSLATTAEGGSNANNAVYALYPKASMTDWSTGEYEVDLLDVTGGAAQRVVSGRLLYDDPGRLPLGVAGNQATVTMTGNQAVVTAIGSVGPAGPANALTIGTVTTGAAGSNASAAITGVAPNQTLSLTIPRGNTGAASTVPGPANTLAIGTVANGAPGGAAAAITGTAPNQTLSLTLPRGLDGNGGTTSEILAAAGVTEQPNFIFDALRSEFFARGTGVALSITAFLAALAGVSGFTGPAGRSYVDSDGLMKFAALNTPRVTFDPVTRACRGMVMEGSRQNALRQSENLNVSPWGKSSVTVNPTAAKFVTGDLTMNKVTENTTTAPHYVEQNGVTITSGAQQCASIFAKAGERRYLQIILQYNAADGAYATFDLLTGTVTASALTGTGTNLEAGMIDWGNGVYRCWVTAVCGTGTTPVRFDALMATSPTGFAPPYTGDGSSGMFMGGAMLEAATRPLTYIPTTTAAVTLAAEQFTADGASWISTSELTMLVEAHSSSVAPTLRSIAELSDGTYNNRALAYISAGSFIARVTSAGAVSASFTVGAETITAPVRIALAAKLNDFSASKDGAAPSLDTAGAMPASLTVLVLGAQAGSGGNFYGQIRRVIIWPKRLSDANIQALTGFAWPSALVAPPIVQDGSKGDIVVSNTGSTWTISASYSAQWLPITGGQMTGDLRRSGAAGTNRSVLFETAGVTRWRAGASAAAESTGNAGSNYDIVRYNDAGAAIDTPVSISQSSGIVGLAYRPLFGVNTPWDSGNFDPAAKMDRAGGSFTGTVAVRQSGSYGYTEMLSGGTDRPGYFAWRDQTGLRWGYMGYGNGSLTALQLVLENSKNLEISGGTVNFDRSIYISGLPAVTEAPLDSKPYARQNGAWAEVVNASITPRPSGRLSLVSGVAVPETDVAAATSVYWEPSEGDNMPIYNGSAMRLFNVGELAVALTTTAHVINKNFDIFAFVDAGAAKIGTGPAWTSDVLRGAGAGTTEIEIFKGLPVNKNSITLTNGASTYTIGARQATLLGSFRTAVAGQARDTLQHRLLSNVYGATLRPVGKLLTGSWSYGSDAFQVSGGGSASNAVAVLNSVGGRGISIDAMGIITVSDLGARPYMGIGIDSNSADSSQQRGVATFANASQVGVVSARYRGFPGLGYHLIYGLERVSYPAGSVTWYGNDPAFQAGLIGEVLA